MTLYAAFDTVQDEPSSSGRRGFKPDEMMDRRMIAAINDKPSVICTWCGNRVRLDAARLQPGGWLSQDYYLCTACVKYGNPAGRDEPGLKFCKCTRCGSTSSMRAFFKDNTDGAVLCEDCAMLTGGHHTFKYVREREDLEWYRVLPLPAEHECGVCHEFKPDVPLYNWAPWLRKAGIAHVCSECNQIASEV